MKKNLLVVLFTTFSMLAYSQSVFLQFTKSLQTCPYDSTQTNLMYDDWEVYKTLDNEWDGTIDSSYCGSLAANGYLDLTNLAAGETVFIRHKFTDSTKILLAENMLYSATANGHVDSSQHFMDLSINCANDMCTGMYLGIDIPDSAGTGRAMRWYQSIPDSNLLMNYGLFDNQICVPTEYFSGNNYMREAIIKLTAGPTGGKNFDFHTFCLVDDVSWLTSRVKDSLNVYGWTWNGVQYFQHQVYEPTLVLYGDTSSYPNLFDMEYVDILPTPNVDTAVTVNIEVTNWGGSLLFQPFTQFRGGYVLNDSTQRHNYNIINNGGNLCFAMIIDKIFNNGNNYIHNAGTVEFNGKTACLEFSERSALIVGDSTTLYYGDNGMGNLALRTRGTIKIGKESELFINNNLVLYELPYDNQAQQIYMTLNEGSKLTFGGNARITNEMSFDGTMKLNIYMKGGIVNLSNLDADSRRLVNLIYDETEPTFRDNIQLLGNPVLDNLRFSITNENANDLTINLLTIDGKSVFNEVEPLQKGINYIETSVSNLPNGLYFLHLQSEEGTFTEKVLIMK